MPGKGKTKKVRAQRAANENIKRYKDKKKTKEENRKMMKEKANDDTQLKSWGISK